MIFFAHIIRNKVYVLRLDFAILISFGPLNPNIYLMITRKLFISKWLDTISENEASCEIFKKAAFLSWKHKRNLI